MGLFKKGPKKPNIDLAKSDANKQKFRELFNQAVPDGGTYKILHAGASESQIEKGLVLDARVTTFYHYVVGYREEDYNVVIVEINREMTQFAEPKYIAVDEIKETNYYPKYYQAWFIYKDADKNGYGMKLQIGDSPATSAYGIPNISQEEEREQFLNFFEKYTDKLRQMGLKVKPWKR